MEPEYSKTIRLGYECFDTYDRVFPSKYLSLFQDVAGEHAELLGCGYSALKSQGMMWIVARSRLDVIEDPRENEPLILTTRVKRPLGLIFEREYEVRRASDSSLLAAGLSSWCISNIVTRRLVRPRDIPYPDSFPESFIYSTSLKAIPDFETEGDPVFSRRVNFTDLDHNRHMNNCRYADILEDAVSTKENQRFKSLEIDFERECVEGDTLSVFLSEKNEKGERFALAERQDGELSFKARFVLD